MEKLAELAGTNKATTRDEFLHPLIVLSHDESPLGDSSRFDISLNLGLSGEEHMSLAGLARTRRSTKALLKEYETAEEAHKDALLLENRKEQDATLASAPLTVETTAQSNEEPEEEDEAKPRPNDAVLVLVFVSVQHALDHRHALSLTIGLLLTTPAVRVEDDDGGQQFETAKPHQQRREEQGIAVHARPRLGWSVAPKAGPVLPRPEAATEKMVSKDASGIIKASAMQEKPNKMTQMNSMPTTKLTCLSSTTSSFMRIMWIFRG